MASQRELLDQFAELAELTALDEGSPQAFRVRAYEKARRELEAARPDLDSATVASLSKLDGIGASTAKKIMEFVATGRIAKLELLRDKFPPAIIEVSRLPGVGPKTLLRMRESLGIESLSDLEAAISEQKIRSLPGLGEKAELRLAKALKALASFRGRTPIAKALPLAHRWLARLRDTHDLGQADVAGSVRRRRESIGDVDLLVAINDVEQAKRVAAFFVEEPFVTDVVANGHTKVSVRTRQGLNVDLRLVPVSAYGAALMYFTGSKAHNVALRQRAIDRGMLLNEYGLFKKDDTEKPIASDTEEAIYRALDLPWIHPVLREDQGELSAASNGTLPSLPDGLRGDLHVHTNLSGDGRSTLEAMVKAALARGYSYLAITEHAEDLPGQGVSAADIAAQKSVIADLQARYPAIRLLHGAELNINRDGGLDYSESLRDSFDFCLASIHTHFDLSRDEQTQRLERAIASPHVAMIGHLSARSIGKRPSINFDLDRIIEAAAEHRTILEVNSALSRLDLDATSIRAASRNPHVHFSINSDAHHETEFPRVEVGQEHALRGWINADNVVNRWPVEKLTSWLDPSA